MSMMIQPTRFASQALLIQNVFSVDLWAGNSTARSITTAGGFAPDLSLIFNRNGTSARHPAWFDRTRGATKYFTGSQQNAEATDIESLTAFNSNGISLGTDVTTNFCNTTGRNAAGMHFKKAAKFFEIVTYVGTGSSQAISHALGSTPGVMIVKSLGGGTSTIIYHSDTTFGNGKFSNMDQSGGTNTDATIWNNTSPTSTQFTVGSSVKTNASGVAYIAYLFADDPSSDGVIATFKYTTNGSGSGSYTFPWNIQWAMTWSGSSSGAAKCIIDTTRGATSIGGGANAKELYPGNLANEVTNGNMYINGTQLVDAGRWVLNAPMVGFAIRAGPM